MNSVNCVSEEETTNSTDVLRVCELHRIKIERIVGELFITIVFEWVCVLVYASGLSELLQYVSSCVCLWFS